MSVWPTCEAWASTDACATPEFVVGVAELERPRDALAPESPPRRGTARYNRERQAAWRQRTVQSEPWKIWERRHYWSERRRLGLERGTLPAAQQDYLKRAAKLHTEDRIINELGGKTSLYASVAEREQEREALAKLAAEHTQNKPKVPAEHWRTYRSKYSKSDRGCLGQFS